MTGVGLAAAWSMVSTAVSVIACRLWPGAPRARLIAGVFAAGALGLAWTGRGAGSAWDALAAAYWYAFWVFGVWLHVYATADRGISVAVLTDLARAGRPLPRAALKRGYADGRGAAYLRGKRLAQIEGGGLIEPAGGAYRATRLGRTVAGVCGRLQALYRFGDTG